jgi:hypothetical protein
MPERKTHCGRKHEFTPENTWTDKNGWRHCRQCQRERNRAYNAKPESRKARVEKYEPSTGVRGKGQYLAVRDACDQGHLFEGENLIREARVVKGKVHYVRRCRECTRAGERQRYVGVTQRAQKDAEK